MADKVEMIGPFHWRQRTQHLCQGICEGNLWWYRKHGEYPPCKRVAGFYYKGKEYCQIHMGAVLIKEKMRRGYTK